MSGEVVVSESKWVSVADASRYFGLKSPKTFYSLIGRGLIGNDAVVRLGRQLRVNVEKIEKMNSCGFLNSIRRK